MTQVIEELIDGLHEREFGRLRTYVERAIHEPALSGGFPAVGDWCPHAHQERD